MCLDDTPSRAFRMHKGMQKEEAEDVVYIDKMRGNTERERELESINMIQYLPVSEATQVVIQQATESDLTL